MTITPHIEAHSPDFPGDSSDQPAFGFRDSLRSIGLWSLGLGEFAAGVSLMRAIAFLSDLKRFDSLLKVMSKTIPASLGIHVEVRGASTIDTRRTYVYVPNHVNIFDMFVLYGAIPQYTRSLEQADHFSWPLLGTFIKAAGQIPVDPGHPHGSAKGLKIAASMLAAGDSLTVLAEGSRTLDGSVGHFHSGAFRLAIQAGVPVVPIAIRGGRRISRRGDWRIRAGTEEVLFAAPQSSSSYSRNDAPLFAEHCRQIVIDLLHGRREPGT